MVRWILSVVLVGCSGPKDSFDSDEGPVDPATEEPVASDGQFTVLSYNVHGLPSIITGDDTPGRMTQIAPRLSDWDILGLQEDWDATNHQELISEVDHETRLWFDDSMSKNREFGERTVELEN